MADDSKISVEEIEVDPTNPSGRPEGTIEKTDPDTNPERVPFIEHEEKIVNDYAEDGTVIGWHKETLKTRKRG